MKKQAFNIITSILIAFIICYFLLKQIEPKDIIAILASIPKLSLAIGFAFYAVFILLKTVRFNLLLRDSTPLKRLYPIISLYTFFGNILPLRTGEISYIYMLKKREQISMTKSTASLLVASLWELLFLLLIAAMASWHLRSALSSRFSYAILLIFPATAALAVGIVLFSASIFPNFWVQTVGKISSISSFSRNRIFQLLVGKISEFVKELGDMSLKPKISGIAVASFAVVASRLGMQCYLVKSMDIDIIDIGAIEVISALAFTTFVNLIPIQGLAGFGSVELPWVLALTAFNVHQESAILAGFSLHIVIICYSMMMGMYGFGNCGLKKKN